MRVAKPRGPLASSAAALVLAMCMSVYAKTDGRRAVPRMPALSVQDLGRAQGVLECFPLGGARCAQLVEESGRYCGYGTVQQSTSE